MCVPHCVCIVPLCVCLCAPLCVPHCQVGVAPLAALLPARRIQAACKANGESDAATAAAAAASTHSFESEPLTEAPCFRHVMLLVSSARQHSCIQKLSFSIHCIRHRGSKVGANRLLLLPAPSPSSPWPSLPSSRPSCPFPASSARQSLPTSFLLSPFSPTLPSLLPLPALPSVHFLPSLPLLPSQ